MHQLTKILSELTTKTKPYDTQATVTRIEDGITWVHIPGGVAETPVGHTIDCSVGDTVQVRVSGGKAWITGNHTAPPTDDTAANKARKVADKALTAAKEALAGLAYFWTDSEGAHVTRIPETEFEQHPEGGNVLLEPSGLRVRDGLTDVADFLSNEMALKTSEGVTVFQVKSAGSSTKMRVTQYTPKLQYKVDGTLRVLVKPDSIPGTLVVFSEIGTKSVVIDGTYYGTVTYDGEQVTTEGVGFMYMTYETKTPLPTLTFGTRVGDEQAFSATLGEELIGSEKGLVCGTYNEEVPGARFIVGAGSSSNRHNAFYVTNNGTYAQSLKADNFELRGESIYTGSAGIPSGAVTTQAGTFVSGEIHYFGPVTTVKVTVRNTASVASGGNIYKGVLDIIKLPPHVVTAGSYISQYSIGASLGTDGTLVVRNTNPSAVTVGASNSITITFSYVRGQ